MAFERKLAAVSPQPFTANGTQFGLVTVADSCLFRVKSSAYLLNTAGIKLAVQIKKVISPTQLIVGQIDNKLSSWMPLDISTWTVASGASIGAEEQDKSRIGPDDHYVAIYEADPVVADRVIQVDCDGDFYDENNPLPVTFDGQINVGNVRITACDNDPKPGDVHSSIRISDCTNDLKINPDGSINVVIEEGPEDEQDIAYTYNQSALVPSGASTTVLTYTVPFGEAATMERVMVSGENIARYDVQINGVTVSTKRTYFGSDLNVDFDFESSNGEGIHLNAGDVVTANVLHDRPMAALFEATLEIIINPTVIAGETVVASYNEIVSIPANATTTIVTYTVPAGKRATLQRVMVSGENIARYDVFINLATLSTKRTYFGGALNNEFEYSGADGGGINIIAGDIVTIKTVHHRPMPSKFEGTIEVIEF